jgi:hypothetical protein
LSEANGHYREGARLWGALVIEDRPHRAPFIAIPPPEYGGIELFVAHLAEGRVKDGIEVVVYTNAESTVRTERRWL